MWFLEVKNCLMAKKSVYLPKKNVVGVEIKKLDYEYFPGFSLSQKQKSINSLKASAEIQGINNFLEVSSKSDNELGIALSAFNLKFETIRPKRVLAVENAFQASKVFENGGPYNDLLSVSAREAKQDTRLRDSGKLIKFRFYGKDYPNTPPTFFYDWLYINALIKNENLIKQVLKYDCFSDIEFNEKKSINCQAYSVALFVSMKKNDIDLTQLKDKSNFLSICKTEYEARWNKESQNLFCFN